MTSLATAIGGMNHWDWCPICRGGLDTGLECDQCGADFMPIYTAFKESLSGGNPGEPKACTPAEERGIVGATGAGQPPDGNPESTGDSADRRSPDDTTGPSSPDESNRHLSSKSTVWMAKNRAYSETCYFGNYATAVAWARGGTVVPVEIQHYTSPALRVPRTDMLAEAVRMIQGYKRAGWLTNPAAGEQAIDFIARASHEPQGWQPIETAPRDTPILLSIFASGDPERERLVVVGGSSDGVTWIDHYDYEIHPPTHWMSLPSAPSTKSGEQT